MGSYRPMCSTRESRQNTSGQKQLLHALIMNTDAHHTLSARGTPWQTLATLRPDRALNNYDAVTQKLKRRKHLLRNRLFFQKSEVNTSFCKRQCEAVYDQITTFKTTELTHGIAMSDDLLTSPV